MTTRQKADELFKIARKVANSEGVDYPSLEERSRFTYAACAEFRRLFKVRPTQNVIDTVRFNYVW